MIQIIGVDIFDDTNAPFIRKHGRLILFSVMLLFLFVGQILYVVKRKEMGASFLDVVSAIPSILIVIQTPFVVETNITPTNWMCSSVVWWRLGEWYIGIGLGWPPTIGNIIMSQTDMVKLIVMTIKRNDIKQLVLEIGQLWRFNYENNKKNEEMQFWTRRMKIWNYAMAGAMAFSFTFFAGVPLLVTIYSCYTEPKPEYKFLVKMYFFSHVDSHLTYSIAVTYQLITCTLCQMCIYTPCDYLLLHQSFSLSALLSLVQIDLLSLKSNNLKDFHFYGDHDCEDIKSIVKTHQMLLRLAEQLNKIFKEIIFSQVYFSSVIICCYLFTAVMSKCGVPLILGDLMASVAILVEIFILAVPGQVIADISSGITHAAYLSPWFEKSYKFRKYIAIIMIRAQKPFLLSALGFSDLTLTMFSKVVSTTWSYLSLLNQMTENLDA